ncbi:TauD/TfdA family dioxygenase [Streptomyces sp. MI02-7b]|nr:TauD/TfdA family dioxygenase [Streptomyces sp. MI02-7b]
MVVGNRHRAHEQYGCFSVPAGAGVPRPASAVAGCPTPTSCGFSGWWRSPGSSSAPCRARAATPEVVHPLVLTHPVTGARSLLLASMVISGISTLAEQESRTLLEELLEHATSAPYVYSHRWEQGDLVVWDNLATLHTASPCDSSHHRRLLYRAAVR